MIPLPFRFVGAKIAGAAMAVLGVVIAFMTAYQRGRRAARQEVATTTAEATARMLDASTNAPKEKQDVVTDLRAGRF